MSNQKISSNPNAIKFANKYKSTSGTGVSRESIEFSFQDGVSKDKENKKTDELEIVYEIRKATKEEKGSVPIKKLSINWLHGEKGQELILIQNGVTVASFTTTIEEKMIFNPLDIWEEPITYIAIPTHTSYHAIESTSTGNFFMQWISSIEFFEHISLLSERGTYTPQLVKMTLLFLSCLRARDLVVAQNKAVDSYTRDIIIDNNEVIADYLDSISMLVGDDIPKMTKLFRNPISVLSLAGSNETLQILPSTELEPIEVISEPITPVIEVTEAVENTPEPIKVAETIHNPDDVDLTDIMEAVKNIK